MILTKKKLCLTLFLGVELFAQTLDFPRLSREQMHELANENRLSHRIFYRSSSRGPDAKWFDAIKTGNLELVKTMVANGQNIEAKDDASLGQTALGWAAFIGYYDIVEFLVTQGANIYATDRADVKSAFKSAVLGGQTQIMEYLYPLYGGNLDLNAQDERDGETALMVAAGNDREGAVKFLLEHNVDVSIVSDYLGKNAFSYACQSKNPKIIKLIQDAGGVNLKTNKPEC